MRRKFWTCGRVLLAVAAALAFAGCGNSGPGVGSPGATPVKAYSAMEFKQISELQGFSEILLQNHLKLYQGYVKNTNHLLEQLGGLLREGKAGSVEYAELKRRLGFEFNGMKLHELYFANLAAGKSINSRHPLTNAIISNFGSVETWKKDFIATGSMRGVGWVVCYLDPHSGRLINFWINEHEVNHPAGCAPLLVMDVWEHAYMLDYQLDRPQYIEAFLNNINWDEVAARSDRSVAAAQAAQALEEAEKPASEPAAKPEEKPHAS